MENISLINIIKSSTNFGPNFLETNLKRNRMKPPLRFKSNLKQNKLIKTAKKDIEFVFLMIYLF